MGAGSTRQTGRSRPSDTADRRRCIDRPRRSTASVGWLASEPVTADHLDERRAYVSTNSAGDTRDVGTSLLRGGRLLGWRVVQYLSGFLGGLVIARTLGPAGRAEYALPLNLATIGWVVLHCSIEAACARMLARREAALEDLARLSSAATAVLGALAFCVVAGVGLTSRHALLGDASGASVLLAAASIPAAIGGQLYAALVLRAGHVSAYGAIQGVLGVIQLLLLATTAGLAHLTPEATLAINLGVTSTITVALAVVLAGEVGYINLAPRTSWQLLGRALRAGLAVHVASISLFLNLRLDLLLVGAILSVREAGVYSLSATLADVVLVATSTLGLAALKDQTDADEGEATRFTLEFVRQSTAVAILFVALVCAVSYPLVLFAYGAAWTGAVLPFAVLCIGAVGLAVEGPVRTLLLRMSRPSAISAAALTAAAVNLGLNLALLPWLGILGAAAASAVSYWIAAFLMLLLLHQRTGLSVRSAFGRPRRGDLVDVIIGRLIYPGRAMRGS
jgi:O-antigen/teichoic acid export membrane protein